MSSPTPIFYLGASGFVGSHVLKQLGDVFPGYPVVALVRGASPEKTTKVKALHPNITILEGDLSDDALIKEWTSKCHVVINVASSDHPASVNATLSGLEVNSKNNPGNPPIYIHTSGMGVTSDNTRGEPVPDVESKAWSDLDFHPKKCNKDNVHMESDLAISAAGERKENPVRTIMVYPCWVYGVGIGPQPTTFGVRIFRNLFESVGHAGTWGPGANMMASVHVKDVATAISVLLKAALDGKADEGEQGYYFVLSDQPRFTMRDFTAAFGDIMYKKGHLKESGSKPMPTAVTDSMGHLGWCSLGGNQIGKSDRLHRLGWQPVESQKKSVYEYMEEEIEIAFKAPAVHETAPGVVNEAAKPQ